MADLGFETAELRARIDELEGAIRKELDWHLDRTDSRQAAIARRLSAALPTTPPPHHPAPHPQDREAG